jgi:hypothetical protein
MIVLYQRGAFLIVFRIQYPEFIIEANGFRFSFWLLTPDCFELKFISIQQLLFGGPHHARHRVKPNASSYSGNR